ncbi:MAG: adenosine deaminase [Actinomycetota bacterium]
MPQNLSTASLQALPKAEIHIHLEGCFELDDFVRLATEAGEPLPRPKERLLEFEGLSEFLEFLDWICGLVRTPDQLARAAYAFAQRVSSSGARYADVIVNPTHWSPWRSNLRGFVEGLDAGFREAEQDGLASAGLCISLLRTQTASEAAELVDHLIAERHPRVVALSVDGNEARAGRTGTKFADAFTRAGRAGLRRTVHAGESSGPEGVWDAIDLLGADRIDHGVRAIEDDRLVAALVERGIPLDVCPSSNLTLGLYASLDEHPIDRLRRAGVRVSVNTDDPALLGLRLEDEYQRCVEHFAWDADTVRSVAETSIRASFAPEELQRTLLTDLAAW